MTKLAQKSVAARAERFSLIDVECRDVHGNHCHLSCKPNFGWQRAWPDRRTPRMNSQARYIRQLKAPIEQQVRTLAKYQGLKLIQCGARGDGPTYNLVKNKKRVHGSPSRKPAPKSWARLRIPRSSRIPRIPRRCGTWLRDRK
jgi:hypothetical protein